MSTRTRLAKLEAKLNPLEPFKMRVVWFDDPITLPGELVLTWDDDREPFNWHKLKYNDDNQPPEPARDGPTGLQDWL